MGIFGQFAATSQFYLYGRKHCTQTGYERARRAWLKEFGFDELDKVDLAGRTFMVTGANSGVGMSVSELNLHALCVSCLTPLPPSTEPPVRPQSHREVSRFLARKGATVHMVCRSEKRGEEARRSIAEEAGNERVYLRVCDCSLEADVRRMYAGFCSAHGTASAPPRLDGLICNAGVLLNEKTTTSEGIETTFACHLLVGTYLLGSLAMGALEATAGSRVVVVSSGGMYNSKFPVFGVAAGEEGSYNGNLAYTYAKRGQVLLCERWAEAHPKVKFVSCHPGWTATPAVDAAYGEMKKYLEPMRTPWEGADAIAWLCTVAPERLEAGAFYLDRKPQVKHMAGPFFSQGGFTKNSREEVCRLWRPHQHDAHIAQRSVPSHRTHHMTPRHIN